MGVFLFSLAALAAATPLAGAATDAVAAASPARRSAGAGASATVTVRILRHSARIGPEFGPPAPFMEPRAAQLVAADGTSVDAIIYDFE